MVLALALLVFFEFFVDLEEDAEAEVVSNDFKPRHGLNKRVDKL